MTIRHAGGLREDSGARTTNLCANRHCGYLAGEAAPGIPHGRVVRGGPDVNVGYSWHIDPASVEFVEMTTEVCDGRPSDVERRDQIGWVLSHLSKGGGDCASVILRIWRRQCSYMPVAWCRPALKVTCLHTNTAALDQRQHDARPDCDGRRQGSVWNMEHSMCTPIFGDLGFIHRFTPGAHRDLTLLLIRSGGLSMPDLLQEGHALASGAAVLSTTAVAPPDRRRGFHHHDMCDIQRQAHMLADFVVLAACTYGFNPRCVVTVGYASGATLGASLLLVRQELLAGAILLHSWLPLVPREPPFLSGIPIFIGAGLQDMHTPAQDIAQLMAIFEAAGADVTLFCRHGDHILREPEVALAREWFQHRFPHTEETGNGSWQATL
jgi:phospholipase/carboxylesterase